MTTEDTNDQPTGRVTNTVLWQSIGELLAEVRGLRRDLERDRKESMDSFGALGVKVTLTESRIALLENRPEFTTDRCAGLDDLIAATQDRKEKRQERQRTVEDKVILAIVAPVGVAVGVAMNTVYSIVSKLLGHG
jgi:hypothetical protein